MMTGLRKARRSVSFILTIQVCSKWQFVASKRRKSAPSSDAADDDGILSDIELTGISSELKTRREDASRDIGEFLTTLTWLRLQMGLQRSIAHFVLRSATSPVTMHQITILWFFAKYIERWTKKPFPFEDHRIRWGSIPCTHGKGWIWPCKACKNRCVTTLWRRMVDS